MKDGIDINEPSDEVVSSKFVNANPQFQQTFLDYVNGKIDNMEAGRQLGLIEKPVA